MAAGLQCWNASGKLIVDLTDYYLRYVGTYTVKMPAGDGKTLKSVATTVPNMTAGGWMAVIKSANPSYTLGDHVTRCQTGKFTTYLMGKSGSASTLTVEVYQFA